MKEGTSAVVTVPSVGIARGVGSRRCYHQLTNLVMASQSLIVVVLRIIKNFCVLDYTVFAANGSNLQFFFCM